RANPAIDSNSAFVARPLSPASPGKGPPANVVTAPPGATFRTLISVARKRLPCASDVIALTLGNWAVVPRAPCVRIAGNSRAYVGGDQSVWRQLADSEIGVVRNENIALAIERQIHWQIK